MNQSREAGFCMTETAWGEPLSVRPPVCLSGRSCVLAVDECPLDSTPDLIRCLDVKMYFFHPQRENNNNIL